MHYPQRMVERDLPIARISAHARRVRDRVERDEHMVVVYVGRIAVE